MRLLRGRGRWARARAGSQVAGLIVAVTVVTPAGAVPVDPGGSPCTSASTASLSVSDSSIALGKTTTVSWSFHPGRGCDATVVRLLYRDATTRLPDDGFSHRARCRAEVLAARWALARGGAVDSLLALAASEAMRAREIDPMDARAWTVSAEVEQVRAEAARARRSAPDPAISAARAFIERALAIDPRLVEAVEIQSALRR